MQENAVSMGAEQSWTLALQPVTGNSGQNFTPHTGESSSLSKT